MKKEELKFSITVNGTKVDLTPAMCIRIYHEYERARHDRQDIEGSATIMQLFELVLQMCNAYESAGQIVELNNEVGALRGLALALATIGIYPIGENVTHFLPACKSFVRNNGPLPS